ncbi:HU family DNA-binding protein [Sphingomonas sp. dw_22]|uniref:HU family DNA-binding protein n=1 Tax=Sphingomonas sp. dw_22 TaxID=2721175 RepID=UPI0031FE7706
MGSLTNRELANRVADEHGLAKADARKLVDAVVAAIAESASSGRDVSLSGLGKFKLKHSAARKGRNPGTGEAIDIAASKRLTFTPAKAVKDKLEG